MDDPAYLRCFRYCGLLCRQAGGQPTAFRTNTILKMITNDFKREGTVEGSWIDHQPIPYRQFAVRTLVYRDGIRRFEDDQLVSYEFLADASTGTLLKLKRIDN